MEICKLRLFLKLVAQVEKVEQIEPLPDIDFNIRAGNTLVGYATADQVRKAFTEERKSDLEVQSKLLLDSSEDDYKRFEESVELVERAFRQYRIQQTTYGGKITHKDKQELRKRLAELTIQLDGNLANEYGVTPKNYGSKSAYEQAFITWKTSHQPFHWFVEFYDIMSTGGFDVIIGNPPYVEYPKVRTIYTIKDLTTTACNNLYAYCSERSLILKSRYGRFGMILPNSSISADKMSPLQNKLCLNNIAWVSNFAWRPSKLFEGANMLLAIVLLVATDEIQSTYTTRYYKWYKEFRDSLFQNLSFNDVTNIVLEGSIPKFPDIIYNSILQKLTKKAPNQYIADSFSSYSKHVIYYFRAVLYWIKVLDKEPIFKEDGENVVTGEMKPIFSKDAEARYILASLLSSSLFFTHYITWSSCQVINARDFHLHFDLSKIQSNYKKRLFELGKTLQTDYQHNSNIMTRNYAKRDRQFVMRKQYFYIRKSKLIIDEIDEVLAQHYGFTNEELDFIINYDIKYRMGNTDDENGEDE